MLLEEETCNVIMNIPNLVEEHVRPIHGAWKIVPTIEVGGHCIYKSTLVLQLNGNHFLSKDRLARIKHSI